jgi:hypothetical protein
MLGFFSLSSRRPTASLTRRLSLESLETRDCPSAFYSTNILPVDLNAAYANQQNGGGFGGIVGNGNGSFNLGEGGSGNGVSWVTLTVGLQYGANQNVTLSGSVTSASGGNVGGIEIEFEGPVDGFLFTDADGTFGFTTQAAYLGNQLAAAVNAPAATLMSSVMPTLISDTAPVIQNFAVEQLQGNNVFAFSGNVVANYPPGMQINFGGAPQSLQGLTTTVAADGSFYLIVQMVNGVNDNGTATAQILNDGWGFSSNIATVDVTVSQ